MKVFDIKYKDCTGLELPCQKSAQIYIQSSSSVGEFRFITPECVIYNELEYQVNELKKNLDAILKKAKAELT